MADSVTAFSSSSEDAITRTIKVHPDTNADKLSAEEFNDHYEIEKTAAEILKNDYKRVRQPPFHALGTYQLILR